MIVFSVTSSTCYPIITRYQEGTRHTVTGGSSRKEKQQSRFDRIGMVDYMNNLSPQSSNPARAGQGNVGGWMVVARSRH